MVATRPSHTTASLVTSRATAHTASEATLSTRAAEPSASVMAAGSAHAAFHATMVTSALMITASHAATHTGSVIHAAAKTALLELLGLLLMLLGLMLILLGLLLILLGLMLILLGLLLEAALLRRILVVVVVLGVLVQDFVFELI